ncbi:uncharacterized protein AB675_6781 [Cyphellophora attinorum]|uniref:Fungal N-terminal domain-containing protein n=1 Tax=Cyphellophora attinorum TaxID=1664694 RepID=A0A0N1HE92_9EURO|nr:uncharacterized protein AB675_6781 [Phialophora attinorum]KPI43663.1 hypothetical protein AB675_6781 [Phialophora attinorum]
MACPADLFEGQDQQVRAASSRAVKLALDIRVASRKCNHAAISTDLGSIATELHLLSITLHDLQEAIEAARQETSYYTDAFRQDLAEILTELNHVLDEVQDCCQELEASDSSSLKPVAWFFKKGRAANLQKHMEALKTTVIVMRTVLQHAKDYDSKESSSGRLAESTPHTMVEERAILEAVFAENRKALQSNTQTKTSHSHSLSSSSDANPELSPGAHGRNLSNATGVESIDVPDVLPPKAQAGSPPKTEDAMSLARRFSKRAHLGIHKSILDMKAEEMATGLRKRWIKMPVIEEAGSGDTALQAISNQADGESSNPEKKSVIGRALAKLRIGGRR